MLSIFVVLCGLWLAPNLYAAEEGPDDQVRVFWAAPTTDTEGGLLFDCPPDHVEGELATPVCLDGYTLHHGPSSGQYDTEVKITDQAAREVWLSGLPAGIRFMAMKAYDSVGAYSEFSNEIAKIVDGPTTPPAPPVILEVEAVAFTVVKQPNRFLLLSIGKVPPGTECDSSNSVNGHSVVPTEAVVWTSPTGSRPVVVVAKCDG